MKKNDLISREDAINSVRWGDTYSKVIDRIKALPSAKPRTGNCSEFPTGWIPCSERLPSGDDVVLTYDRWDEMGTCWYEEEYGHWKTAEENIIIDRADIIAWMPLPKPYKESEVEE